MYQTLQSDRAAMMPRTWGNDGFANIAPPIRRPSSEAIEKFCEFITKFGAGDAMDKRRVITLAKSGGISEEKMNLVIFSHI